MTKLKITLITILTLSIILSGIGFYLNNLAFEASRIQPILEEKFLGKITEIGNYSDKDYYTKQDPEIILIEYNFIHPVLSIILNDCVPLSQYTTYKPKNECDSFTIITFHLERTGILTWKVLDFYEGSILKTTIDKTRNLIKNNDIANLPREIDGQSIGVHNKFNSKQVEQVKKDQEQKDRMEAFNKLPKEERVKICQDDLAKNIQYYEEQINNPKIGVDYVSPASLEYFKKGFIDEVDCSKV